MNTKFRIVVTSGGGMGYKRIRQGHLGNLRGLGNILFLRKGWRVCELFEYHLNCIYYIIFYVYDIFNKNIAPMNETVLLELCFPIW